METFQIECGSCGGVLEADETMAGTEVQCPHCEQALMLPTLGELGIAASGGETAAGAAEHARGDPEPPAPEPVADEDADEEESAPAARVKNRGAKQDSKRGSGGAVAGSKRRPSEPVEPAAKGHGKRKGDTGARKKPGAQKSGKGSGKALLFAGAGAGLLVIVGIIAAVVMSGGKPSGDGEKGGGSKGGASEETKSKKSQYEKKASSVEGSTNPADWVDLGDLASAAGMEDTARAHWRKALELQPDYTAAMKKLGYVKYEVPAELDEYSLEKPLPEELTASAGKWVSPESLDNLRRVEREYKTAVTGDIDRKASDPFHAAVEQVKSAFLSRQGIDQYEFKVKRSEPFVVFEQTGKKGEGSHQPDQVSERKVEEKLRMLQALHSEMKKRLLDSAGLTMNPNLPLVVIALKDRKAFDDLHTAMGGAAPANALAYFHRIHTYIILYNDPFGSAGLKAKEFSDGVVFHEGTHQILNAYVRKGKGFNSADAVDIPFWVNEGLAEFFGGIQITGETDAEGFDVYHLCRPHRLRLQEFKQARLPQRIRRGNAFIEVPPLFFNLDELIECWDQSRIHALAQGKLDNVSGLAPELKTMLADNAVSLVYAQGSSFFLFCYNYSGGKYASACNTYLKNAFLGRHHTKYFKEAFGTEDLSGINKEWLDYIEKTTKDIENGTGQFSDDEDEDEGD